MKTIDLTEYTVNSNKFPDGFSGFSLVMLSDLHSNVYGISLERLDVMIRAAKPDAIVIVGDMINEAKRDRFLAVTNYLASLASKYPTFYALGNHEYSIQRNDEAYGYRFLTYRRFLEEAGMNFLVDETVYLEKENARLALSGVAIDMPYYYRTPPIMGEGLMDHHLGTCDESIFNLLLAHHPDYFANYALWGADLTLAGHKHGGIIRTKRGGLISTSGKLFFPEFDEGAYETEGGAVMVVGRGLGTHHVLVRVNNHPELVVVHLKPETGQNYAG